MRNNRTSLLILSFILQAIQNENILVGYKAFSSTDEEFLICTTDRAKQFIEQTQIQVERELKQRVEKSMFRVPGPWESKSSEKDIEDIKSIPARDKVNHLFTTHLLMLNASQKIILNTNYDYIMTLCRYTSYRTDVCWDDTIGFHEQFVTY